MLRSLLTILSAAIILAVCLAMAGSSHAAGKNARSSEGPPRGYRQVVPCDSQVGQLWAPAHVFEPFTGNDEPMLGFYQNQLVGMVYYLSETHLYPRLSGGARWGLGGQINAAVDSITIAPATRRPNRDPQSYEITVLLHHDPPIEVKCAASNAPTTSQGQKGGNKSNSGGGTTGNLGGTGGGTKPPKK